MPGKRRSQHPTGILGKMTAHGTGRVLKSLLSPHQGRQQAGHNPDTHSSKPSTGPAPPQATPTPADSPHLPTTLWVPEHLSFTDRQMAKVRVTVAATGIQVDLKQKADPMRVGWHPLPAQGVH